ncbi:hypothetical protein [Flavobacterium notoginsengisoli]|uniref:hypothetical protein n=1 Tax=Flavobacterium notoginsengisoli TaxID=1478199 RepID=UPI0036319251
MANQEFHRVSVVSENFDAEILDALEKRNVSISIKWSSGGPIRIHKINWKLNSGSWNMAIKYVVNSTSGNELFNLGTFDLGANLTIKVKIEPFANIQQAICMVVQTNPGVIIEREPRLGLKSLTNGELWNIDLSADIK